MKFIIYVIENTIWESANQRKFLDDELIELWENSFSISYAEYRKELKKISMQCLKDVEDFEIIENPKELTNLLKNDEEAVITSTSDCDWLSPFLSHVDWLFLYEELDAVTWRQIILTNDGFLAMPIKLKKSNEVFFSNNFLIQKSFLASNFKTSESIDMLEDHKKLNEVILNNENYLKSMRHIPIKENFPEHTSIQVVHLGMPEVLKPIKEKENNPINKLQSLAKNFQNLNTTPPNITWSEPYLKQLAKLHTDVI